MIVRHAALSAGRWEELSLVEQLANVGSEVERAISWKKKRRADYCNNACMRAFELIDLTIQDRKNKARLREITRMREVLADCFYGANQYHSSDVSWKKYFLFFAFVSRRNI